MEFNFKSVFTKVLFVNIFIRDLLLQVIVNYSTYRNFGSYYLNIVQLLKNANNKVRAKNAMT